MYFPCNLVLLQNEVFVNFNYEKIGQTLLQIGATFHQYKAGQLLFQSRATIAKQSNFFYKVG